MNEEIINNGRIIMVREALEEVKAEAEQMITNISTLLEELEKVKTKEDAKRFDDLADELTMQSSCQCVVVLIRHTIIVKWIAMILMLKMVYCLILKLKH